LKSLLLGLLLTHSLLDMIDDLRILVRRNAATSRSRRTPLEPDTRRLNLWSGFATDFGGVRCFDLGSTHAAFPPDPYCSPQLTRFPEQRIQRCREPLERAEDSSRRRSNHPQGNLPAPSAERAVPVEIPVTPSSPTKARMPLSSRAPQPLSKSCSHDASQSPTCPPN